MSHSISDFFLPENHSRPYRSACRNCCRRKNCPYACDRVSEEFLPRTVSQGEDAAQWLTVEARRLFEEISCADNICQLLRADRAVEFALAHMLQAEMALFEKSSVL